MKDCIGTPHWASDLNNLRKSYESTLSDILRIISNHSLVIKYLFEVVNLEDSEGHHDHDLYDGHIHRLLPRYLQVYQSRLDNLSESRRVESGEGFHLLLM